MFDSITSFLKAHESELLKTQQRIAVVLHLNPFNDKLETFVNALWHKRKLVISANIENALPAELAFTKLGEEYDLLVFDARDFFNPNVLGVVSGVLCGGGCLIILLPEENEWKKSTSLLLNHVNGLLSDKQGVYYFKDESDIPADLSIKKNKPIDNEVKPNKGTYPYRTNDQKVAVELIIKSLQLKKEYCCVLTSGRGRGKSTSLGLICAEILNSQVFSSAHKLILVSAPKLSVADPLFKHLQQQCVEGKASRAVFNYNNSTVRFIAPDLLLETTPEADVVFIDEAAAIPLSMLEKLLSIYPRIVFSTTTHGYEGTGRGFVFKFYKLLDKSRPGWQGVELNQPVRWAENDPLEKWIEEVLFLNVKLSDQPELPVVKAACCVKLIDRKELIKDKEKLAQVFSLLVFSHYRTSPSDFQYILDNESVRIYSLQYNNENIGVVIVNQEGEFDEKLSKEIYRGKRRPKGNLLAQTLCFHAGSEQAASLSYARIMRIAVHPGCQQMGLGSLLLDQVMKNERMLGVDILGSSFSATPALLDFWSKADLSILRMGFSRDHVTASHSAVMAKAFTLSGEEVVTDLSNQFRKNIFLWLQGPLSGLPKKIKQHVLLCSSETSSDIDIQSDLKVVESFSKFNRNYDACMPAIMRYLDAVSMSINCCDEKLNKQQQQIIMLSYKYTNNWKLIVNEMGLQSNKQAVKLLREALRLLTAI